MPTNHFPGKSSWLERLVRDFTEHGVFYLINVPNISILKNFRCKNNNVAVFPRTAPHLHEGNRLHVNADVTIAVERCNPNATEENWSISGASTSSEHLTSQVRLEQCYPQFRRFDMQLPEDNEVHDTNCFGNLFRCFKRRRPIKHSCECRVDNVTTLHVLREGEPYRKRIPLSRRNTMFKSGKC